MEGNLSKGDMIRYIWYTRDYVLLSSESAMIESFIEYCPFCGEDIGSQSVLDEYDEAYEKATDDEHTSLELENDHKLEAFRTEFLTSVESQEKTPTIDSNQNMT